jgi:hypothetical protein
MPRPRTSVYSHALDTVSTRTAPRQLKATVFPRLRGRSLRRKIQLAHLQLDTVAISRYVVSHDTVSRHLVPASAAHDTNYSLFNNGVWPTGQPGRTDGRTDGMSTAYTGGELKSVRSATRQEYV